MVVIWILPCIMVLRPQKGRLTVSLLASYARQSRAVVMHGVA